MSTTITTGISTKCCCVNSSEPLITTTYKEGAGDKGYTSTSPTTRGEKAEEARVKLWTRLSKLQVVIAQTIPYFMVEDTRTCLDWVWENVRSLSSLAYLQGATDTHAFPQVAIAYMDKVIGEMKAELGPSQSFIQWEDKDLLHMENLWTEVRDTETMYRKWAATAEVHDMVQDRVETVLTILNRLSSYLWWSMRYENKLRGCRERVWQGYVTPFPFEV